MARAARCEHLSDEVAVPGTPNFTGALLAFVLRIGRGPGVLPTSIISCTGSGVIVPTRSARILP